MENNSEAVFTGKLVRKNNQDRKALAEEIIRQGGKIIPQVPEVEEAVLGAVMLDKEALNTVSEILRPECFYREENQKVYAAVLDLFSEGQPVDVLTVADKLKENNDFQWVGGARFLARLASRISSAAHVEIHARIVLEHFIKREIITVSNSAVKEAYEDQTDVFELLDRTETSIFKIAEKNIGRNVVDMKSLVKRSIEAIKEKKNSGDGVTGIPTGLIELDRTTGGWQNSDLVIIAARPGMGKTAFVLTAARNAAVQFRKAVAVFSLEMPAEQLVNRLISAESGLPGERLRKGNLEEYEWAQLHNRITDLANAPLFIDDTPAITPVQLRAKCRRLKQQHDIGLIIIDYLQLMNVEGLKGGTRTEEVSLISRSLKALAKELNVPVIALSQLSRSVETRGGIKRPLLSDLRESGAIEQDADIVSFLYRPEYYGLKEYDLDGRSTEGLVEFILAKHRNGDVGTVLLRFLAKNTKFVDYDQNFVTTSSGYVDASLPEQISGDRIKMGSKLNSTLPDSGFMDIPDKPKDSNDVPF